MATITAEQTTVWRVKNGNVSRRYLSKYTALKAYCINRIIDRLDDRGELDRYEGGSCEVRDYLYSGKCATDLSRLMRRYYRFCLHLMKKVPTND